MTVAEHAILGFFRQYKIGPAEMLFFNPSDCKVAPGMFRSAMESLMRQGFVIKERPKHAYSLTRNGYDLSMTIEVPKPKLAAARR